MSTTAVDAACSLYYFPLSIAALLLPCRFHMLLFAIATAFAMMPLPLLIMMPLMMFDAI